MKINRIVKDEAFLHVAHAFVQPIDFKRKIKKIKIKNYQRLL